MADTYWPKDDLSGDSIVRFAPSIIVEIQTWAPTDTITLSQWNDRMEPYYRQWIDTSKGEKAGAVIKVVQPGLFLPSRRPSNAADYTDPAYDWSTMDDILNLSIFSRDEVKLYWMFRMERKNVRFAPWWPSNWAYLPSGRDEYIINWARSETAQFMKDMMTAVAAKYNNNTKMYGWGYGEEQGTPSSWDSIRASFINHSCAAMSKMMCHLQQFQERVFQLTKHNLNVSRAGVAPKAFIRGCGDNGNFPTFDCDGGPSNPGYFGQMQRFNSVIQNPPGGLRRCTAAYCESNEFRIDGTMTIDSPWGVNTKFPLSSERKSPANLTWAIVVWYLSYKPRASGSKASAGLGHPAPDPAGVIPCNHICISKELQGSQSGSGNADIDRAFKFFGANGTQAAIWPPIGFDPTGGSGTPVQFPFISDAHDESFYNSEAGIDIDGGVFESSQGTGWVRVYPNNLGTGGTYATQTITSWADTQITITFVQGALSSGVNYLFVQNDNGDLSGSHLISIQATSTEPVIQLVSHALVLHGDTGIVISGADFGSTQGGGFVELNLQQDGSSVAAIQTITAWTDTSITFTVNVGSHPSGTAWIIVHDSDNNVSVGWPITINNVVLPGQPFISSITGEAEDEIYNGQTNVIMIGTNFGSSGWVRLVEQADGFGITISQDVISWTDTQIIFNIDSGNIVAGEFVYLSVLRTDGALSEQFEVFLVSVSGGLVQISDVTPSLIYDGVRVQVDGSNFGAFGGDPFNNALSQAEVTPRGSLSTIVRQQGVSWNPARVIFDFNRGSLFSGPADIHVINEAGDRSNAFPVTISSLLGAPIISRLSDSDLRHNDEGIMIYGANFGTQTTDSNVTLWVDSKKSLGGTQTITEWTDKIITFKVNTTALEFPTRVGYITVKNSDLITSEVFRVTIEDSFEGFQIDDGDAGYSDTAGFSDAISEAPGGGGGGEGEDPADIVITNTSNNGTGGHSWTHAIGVDDDYVIVCVSMDRADAVISGVDVNGVSMTLAKEAFTASSRVERTTIFFLLSSGMPSAGNATINIDTNKSPGGTVANAFSGYNLKQQAPEATSSSTAASTASINTDITTVTDGALVIDSICSSANDADLTPNSGQVLQHMLDNRGFISHGCSTMSRAAAGSGVIGWTAGGGAEDYIAHAVAAFASVKAVTEPGDPPPPPPPPPPQEGLLRVSGHNLIDPDGNTYFMLGDDVWAFFGRFTVAEATEYLNIRKAQGFNAVAAWMMTGWNDDNKNGDPPFGAQDDTGPPNLNNSWWTFTESLLDLLEEKGFYCMFHLGGLIKEEMNEMATAFFGTHAQHLDKTYRVAYAIAGRLRTYPNIMYSTGQDMHPLHCSKVGDDNCANNGAKYKELCKYMAKGLADGHNQDTEDSSSTSQDFSTAPLITWHPGNVAPTGGTSSSEFFHTDSPDWCSINMAQTGRRHTAGADRYMQPAYDSTETDYDLSPIKPTGEGENSYDDAIIEDESGSKRRTAYHSRLEAYWSMFAGSTYHFYGHTSMWQLYQPGYSARSSARTYYDQGPMTADSAVQMGYMKSLIESRPLFHGVPDQSVFTTSESKDHQRLQAIREPDGKFAMVYITNGRDITIDMSKIGGSTCRAWWFDPREGTASVVGDYSTSGTRSFNPPGSPSSFSSNTGNDYVLILDNLAMNYPSPGATLTPNIVDVVGHRGGASERPENTLAAMRYSYGLGCGIEMDVRLSSDGVVVVIHDSTLGRTTNGSGDVIDKTAAELAALDAGSHFGSQYASEGVPSLDDVLVDFKNNAASHLIASVDTKDENSTMWAALKVILDARGLWDRVFIEVDSDSKANAIRAVDSRFLLAIWCNTSTKINNAISYGGYDRIHIPDNLAAYVDNIQGAGSTCMIFTNSLAEWCAVKSTATELPLATHTNKPGLMFPIASQSNGECD